MKILVEIDGDGLVEFFKAKETASVVGFGDTYLVTAPILDILDGALENMVVVFEEGDGD